MFHKDIVLSVVVWYSVGLATIRSQVPFPGGDFHWPTHLARVLEAESREISISCKNLFLNGCKINNF